MEDILDLEEKDLEQTYATFWERVAAFIIDSAVMYGLTLFFGIITFVIILQTNSGSERLFGFIPLVLIVVNWLYFALFESSSYQGTIGKRLLKIRVMDYEGERINFLRASLRHLGRLISMMTLFIGFIVVAFTENKQGLQDMMARTYVKKNLPNATKLKKVETEILDD